MATNVYIQASEGQLRKMQTCGRNKSFRARPCPIKLDNTSLQERPRDTFFLKIPVTQEIDILHVTKFSCSRRYVALQACGTSNSTDIILTSFLWQQHVPPIPRNNVWVHDQREHFPAQYSSTSTVWRFPSSLHTPHCVDGYLDSIFQCRHFPSYCHSGKNHNSGPLLMLLSVN